MNNLTHRICFFIVLFFVSPTKAQLNSSGAYLIGNNIEVGINNYGFEGAPTLAGSHARSGQFDPSVYFGFVANPQLNSWAAYNGDFFTPGSPENGFGLEIGGVNYSNNAYDATWTGTSQFEINGSLSNYSVTGNCLSVEWNGTINNFAVKIVYHMMTNQLFYTTEVTITNNSGAAANNIYYYRNLDPDNNQYLNFDYSTNNTITSQPTTSCPKALVSASQDADGSSSASYLGLAAIGLNFRVAHGGFSNRDGSDIWNGIFPLSAAVAPSFNADEAISLAYKIATLAPGASEKFEYTIILDASQIDEAFANLYDFTAGSDPSSTSCAPIVNSITICAGLPTTLEISGPSISDYVWTWTPNTALSSPTGAVVTATPTSSIVYTVTGVPTNPCLALTISKTINVTVGPAPDVVITDPGPQCGSFPLSSLVVTDLNATPNTTTTFHSVIPTSATDMTNLWGSAVMNVGDVVYVMIADPVGGCYNYAQVIITFGGTGEAGPDNSQIYCNAESMVNLFDLLGAGVQNTGTWNETTVPASGTFNPTTADFTISSLPLGVYTFSYSMAAAAPCPNDTAFITINVASVFNAGLDADTAFCYGSISSLNLNQFIVGGDVGGDWSAQGSFSGQLTQTGMLNTSTLLGGNYVFNYVVAGGSGSCPSDTAKMAVTVYSSPLAAFTISPIAPDVSNSQVDLTNMSVNAVSYFWDFGDNATSVEVNPSHLYSADANVLYPIKLIATSANGCIDSLVKTVLIKDILVFYIPNTFTPDHDEYNEVFKPIFTSGYDPTDYRLIIYNRWGQVVFESSDATIGWDGTYGGVLVQDGAYIWRIEFKETMSDKRYLLNGHLNLFK